jgi:TRAP-type C4-dicarboxylate transport system permease small subunit
MHYLLKKASDFLNTICKRIGALLLLAMVVIIVIQVIARYILGSSLSWSEETSRFFFIWVVLLGTVIGVHDGSHVAVEFLLNMLPKSLNCFLKFFYTACLCVLSGVMVWSGIELSMAVALQLSPATRISMTYVYAAVPVCSGIMFVHLLRNFFPAPEIESSKREGA